MVGSHIGESINVIHFLGGQRRLRRILDYIKVFSIALCHRLSIAEIGILVLDGKASGIQGRLSLHFFIGGQFDTLINAGNVLCLIDSARDKGDIMDGNAACQCICNLHNGLLSHSIGNQVCLTV